MGCNHEMSLSRNLSAVVTINGLVTVKGKPILGLAAHLKYSHRRQLTLQLAQFMIEGSRRVQAVNYRRSDAQERGNSQDHRDERHKPQSVQADTAAKRDGHTCSQNCRQREQNRGAREPWQPMLR